MNSSIFIFVAFLIGNGMSASISPLANWPLVEERIRELEELVMESMFAIYNDAISDNATVGGDIGKKVSDAAENGMDLLNTVMKEVENKTLSREIARSHLGQLYLVFTDLYADIEEDLEKLSEEAKNRIDNDFSHLFLTIPRVAESIYAALEEVVYSCGVLGFNSNETVKPPNPIDENTGPGIQIWKVPVFSVAYPATVFHPHNKYLESGMQDDQLVFETTRDFPSFKEDTNATVIHRIIQFSCTDGTISIYEFDVELDEGPIIEPTLAPIIK